MKKLLFSIILICTISSLSIGLPQTSQVQDIFIAVGTLNTDLVYKVNRRDGRLYQSYLGHKINNIAGLNQLTDAGHLAYATFGTDNLFEPAIRMIHNDGNPSLELKYVSHNIEKQDANVTITHILLKDPEYPVEVTLNIKSFSAEDVIEQWVEIVQKEPKPLTIYNYASSMLHFDASKYWLTQFNSKWGEEMKIQESELTSGIKIIDSKLGAWTTMYQSPGFFLSLNEKSDENNGELIAGTLAWSGNFQLLFELDEKNSLRVISGINPFASEYTILPGRPFKTPSFIFTFSNHGKGLASRNLHRWALNYGIMDGSKARLSLMNSWATDEKKITNIIDDTKKLGLDMYLLDDGWFGTKYPRDDDASAGLGDWQVNKIKFPNGLGYLIREAGNRGVKLGIWIEPEMVNPKSELYKNHPDWVLKLPNRPEDYFRNQLMLDLSNPKVLEFVYNVVDELVTTNPGIAYIKWDCNRMMTNQYSVYLKDKQSHLYIDYVNGLYSVLDRLHQKYPHLPMMLCASGGGRVDYGALRYFTEFWASDNSEPLSRIYIQWGYSYFFPAISVCNHVTGWGETSLKFKTDVAMMGTMGYGLEVKYMTENELKFSQDAIVTYRRLSDVIWHGDLYRLISPYEEHRAVLMYVNSDKNKAVLFAYTLNSRLFETFNRVRLQGLDPAKTYKIQEINVPVDGAPSGPSESGKSYSGDYLMKIGLNVGSTAPLTSSVFEITE